VNNEAKIQEGARDGDRAKNVTKKKEVRRSIEGGKKEEAERESKRN